MFAINFGVINFDLSTKGTQAMSTIKKHFNKHHEKTLQTATSCTFSAGYYWILNNYSMNEATDKAYAKIALENVNEAINKSKDQ